MKCYYNDFECTNFSTTVPICTNCYKILYVGTIITTSNNTQITQKCPICKRSMPIGIRLMCDECYNVLIELIMERRKKI